MKNRTQAVQKNHFQFTIICFTGLLSLFPASCPVARQQTCRIPVHFHDNHALSFPVILDKAAGQGGLTLVLLDAYSDIALQAADDAINTQPAAERTGQEYPQEQAGIDNSNWVGALLAGSWVKQVYWVPCKAVSFPGSTVMQDGQIQNPAQGNVFLPGLFRERVKIMDWQELKSLPAAEIPAPLVISLDINLPVLTTGQDNHLLQEMLDTFFSWQPEVITVVHSNAGQCNTQKAWQQLTTAYSVLADKGTPFLESSHPDLWEQAPAALWILFRKYPPAAGNTQAAALLQKITAGAEVLDKLEKDFSAKRLEAYLDTAKRAVSSVWEKGSVPEKQPVYFAEKNNRGIAVRFVSGKKERGCLAFYTGVANFHEAAAVAAVNAAFFDPRYPAITSAEKNRLDMEVTVFGAFIPMNSAAEFVPGIDALLLETPANRTLLQPSIAVERNLSAYQFLEAITRKAGLAPGSWKSTVIRFYKAPVVSLRRPYRQ